MKKKIIINIIDILCMLYVVGYFLWSLIIPVRIGFSCDIINKILFIFIIVYFSKRIMMKHEYPKPIYAHLNHFKFLL